MPKLIYENDQGQQTSFEASNEVINDLKNLYNINVWDEIWTSFKQAIQESESVNTPE